MSKKHFDDYYNKLTHQYFELLDELKEVQEYCMNNIVDPAIEDNLKKIIAPVKESYETVTYIKYLLDMPNKSQKVPKYMQQQVKLQQIGQKADVITKLSKGNETINKLKDIRNETISN